MLGKLAGGLGKATGAIGQLPLPHRIGLGAIALAVVFGGLFASSTLRAFVLPAAVVIGGVIALLFLIQVLVRAFERKRNAALSGALEKDSQAASLLSDEERKEALAEIRDQWSRALGELKNVGLNVYSMPWFMLIGEPASGKTTTLRNSGLEFPIGTEALSGFGGTRNCDWWFTNESVILDTAGRFTFEEKNAPDAEQWTEFLRLLKRYRPRCPINGVLVAIPCTSLLEDTPDEQERKAKNIREKLTQLEQVLEVQFPVFVVVTKCDLVLGFAEFFTRLPALEQRQLFGWSKPHPYDQPVKAEEWQAVFRGLHGRLSQWRNRFLADDPEGADRDRLYALPEELAALEVPLTTYLREMFLENRYMDPLFMRGVYFTSGLQKGRPIDRACANLFQSARAAGAQEPLFEKSTAFFIRDFYRKKLFIEKGLIQPTRVAQRRARVLQRIAYGAGGLLGVVLVVLLTVGAMQQKSGVEDPLRTLRAFDHASDEWAEGNRRAAPPMLEAKSYIATVKAITTDEKLSAIIGSSASIHDLGDNLTRAGTVLLNDTVFRRFGDRLQSAFARTPRTWQEYELFSEALVGYLTLIDARLEQRGVPLTDESQKQAADAWRAMVAFVGSPAAGAASGTGDFEGDGLKDCEQLYLDLLDLARKNGRERPTLRPAFAPKIDSFRVALGHLREFTLDTARGSPTLSTQQNDDALYSAGVWLRANALSIQLGADHAWLRGYCTPPYKTLAAADEALKTWLDRAAGFLRAAEELKAIADGTAKNPIRGHNAGLIDLLEIYEPLFARMEERVSEETAWRTLVQETRNEVKEFYAGKTNEIRGAIVDNPSPFALQRPAQVPDSDRFRIDFDAARFGGDVPLIAACRTAMETQTRPIDTAARSTLHRELETRLSQLDTKVVFKEAPAERSDLVRALGPPLATAQSVLITRALKEHHEQLQTPANRWVFMETFIPEGISPRVTFGSKTEDLNTPWRASVACALLEHVDLLLQLSDDPRYERLLADTVRPDAQATLGTMAMDYLKDYREAWMSLLGRFQPARPAAAGWNAYLEMFESGFGRMASDGNGLGKTFLELIVLVRANVEPVARVADAERTHPVLREIVRDGMGSPFRRFLQAYGTPAKEGQPDLAQRLATEYTGFAEAVTRLGPLRDDNRREFFDRIFTSDGTKPPNGERLTACERTIVEGETANVLGAEATTGELLAVVQGARAALEVEILKGFNEEWQKTREESYKRIADKYPFADDGTQRTAPDATREDFKNLFTRIEGIRARWWRFLDGGATNRILLRLPRESVRTFVDHVFEWGKLLGFGEKGLKMEGVKVLVNAKDDVTGEVRPFVDAQRTVLAIDIGSVKQEMLLGVNDQEPVEFVWDFSRKPMVRFTLYDNERKLDEKTRWPADDEQPSSWLALPRLLLEHAAEGWPREERREWLVWSELDLDGQKHVIYYKFTLPDGRALPARPAISDAGWNE